MPTENTTRTRELTPRCVNTVGWSTDNQERVNRGQSCGHPEKGWCENTGMDEGVEEFGPKLGLEHLMDIWRNYPQDNCCGCGKQRPPAVETVRLADMNDASSDATPEPYKMVLSAINSHINTCYIELFDEDGIVIPGEDVWHSIGKLSISPRDFSKGHKVA